MPCRSTAARTRWWGPSFEALGGSRGSPEVGGVGEKMGGETGEKWTKYGRNGDF